MPRKTTKKQVIEKKGESVSMKSMLEQLQLSESYMSLLLGILVVLIAGMFTFFVLREGHLVISDTQVVKNESENAVEDSTKSQQSIPLGKYTVQDGDSIKIIAVKYFGSQDAADQIVSSNKLQNPNIIDSGTVIVIPRIDKSKLLAVGVSDVQKKPIKDSTYEILVGDTLWDIAVRAYDDGYKWATIAKVNNIDVNFDLPVGYKLTIPR